MKRQHIMMKTKSTYAVTGERYAGGYIGYMNIGSAAFCWKKDLSVLGKSIGINNVLDALNVCCFYNRTF